MFTTREVSATPTLGPGPGPAPGLAPLRPRRPPDRGHRRRRHRLRARPDLGRRPDPGAPPEEPQSQPATLPDLQGHRSPWSPPRRLSKGTAYSFCSNRGIPSRVVGTLLTNFKLSELYLRTSSAGLRPAGLAGGSLRAPSSAPGHHHLPNCIDPARITYFRHVQSC